jgi:uncharacterized protein YhdP
MDARPSNVVRRVRAWPRRVLITVVTIVVLLVAVRIALPYIVCNRINHRLKAVPGYRGQVGSVTISLWRGAYALNGISIFKQNGHEENPFFVAKYVDFSIAWRELIHGKIVSDILLEHPEVTIVKGPTPETSQKDTDKRWQSVVEDIFPVNIQHLEIRQGVIRYIDDTRTPRVDLFIKNMEAVATGLRNRPADTRVEYPAKVQIEGDSLGGGRLSLLVDAEPLAEKPHFHLSLKVTHVNLPDLNESMRAVANVDVAKGTFEMVLEMGAKDGAFQGYVKPFFNDLDFKTREDKKGSLAAHLWEKAVSGLAWLVKNRPRDQVATRIPFQGEFGDSQIGLWATVRNLFRHGFVRAFNPVVEGSVDPDKVPPPSEVSPKADKGKQKQAEKQIEQGNDAKSSDLGEKQSAHTPAPEKK